MSNELTVQDEDSQLPEVTPNRSLEKLTLRQKAYLIAYVQATNFDKLDAWCLARYNHTYDQVIKHLQTRYAKKWTAHATQIRADAYNQWRIIEGKFGGINNVMDFIGLDDTRLMMEHKKLMNAQKPMVINKNTGEIVWYDDAGAQVKNLEVLHKVKGNIDTGNGMNVNIGGTGNPLRIDFGSEASIPQDNMTINGDVQEPTPIEGTVTKPVEEPTKRGPGRPKGSKNAI